MASSEGENMPAPVASFDGGTLDCGNGLLLLIRKHIDPLRHGEILELFSSESSVRDDLPAWCRLTKNELILQEELGNRTRFLLLKGSRTASTTGETRTPDRHTSVTPSTRMPMPLTAAIKNVSIPESLPRPVHVPPIAPFSVMGIGSWPRPRWLVRAMHEYLQGQMSEEEFQRTADDGVRLAVQAQVRAGVDVITDGEQRRDDYASFVADRLDNCQLIPITDLLPYVDHPDDFASSLNQLDVPAEKVRHPAVFGPLGRSRSLAEHEFQFVRTQSERPVKIALPGPYLLTRIMWMECISDRAYPNREALARDIVRVLREEVHYLLSAGVSVVQFDEPVLTEVVHGRPATGNRTFMCGALGSRGESATELTLAAELLRALADGLPHDRLALHICRGNWTRDESLALVGDYGPLIEYLAHAPVATLFLELCTKRAGEMRILTSLPETCRIGVGVVDQKSSRIETPDEIVARAEEAVSLFGPDRVLLNPDCGFATFADNPIADAEVAEAKLGAIVAASRHLRAKYFGSTVSS